MIVFEYLLSTDPIVFEYLLSTDGVVFEHVDKIVETELQHLDVGLGPHRAHVALARHHAEHAEVVALSQLSQNQRLGVIQ